MGSIVVVGTYILTLTRTSFSQVYRYVINII